MGIFLVELVGGYLTKSLALLADAGHLLTDIAAVTLAILAQWFSKRPASGKRTFGFRRLEILAALINGLTLWVMAVYIVYEAVVRMWHPPKIATLPMVLIATIGLLVQSGVALILSKAKGESLNVKGAYVHALTDAVQSAGVVIVGIVIILTGLFLLDSLVSIVIAALITWSGGKVVWESTHILMEGTPDELDLDVLADAMSSVEGVDHVSDLHAWSLTSGYNALSAHIVACPGLSAEDRERLSRSLRDLIVARFPIHHVTLQVEEECRQLSSGACGSWLPKAKEGSP